MAVTLNIEFVTTPEGKDGLVVTYTDHGDNSSWKAAVDENTPAGVALLEGIEKVWKFSDDPES